MTAEAPMTLRELFKLPALRRGAPEILSGHESLDQPVRWVHAGEVPNIASLLKGQELLLTTGMGIDTSAHGCRRFIDDLAKRGVAGLAIELGSTLARVPASMVEQARRYSLPIVALHRELPFVEVTEAAHQAIVSRQVHIMHHGDEVRRRFTDLLLNGGGVPEILSTLAETIANPVVLDKAGGEIVYHAVHQSSDAAVVGAWETSRRGSGAEIETVARSVPAAGGERWGTLTALGLDSVLGDLDTVAVDRAIEVIALALRQYREEAILAVRERGDFLNRLINREIDDAEASIRIRALGFPKRTCPLLAIAIVPTAPSPTTMATEEATWALVWRDIRQEFAQRHWPMVIGSCGDSGLTLALIALTSEADRQKQAQLLVESIERATEYRFGAGNLTVVAVGRIARTWEEVRASMGEAEETVLAATHGPKRTWHDATSPDIDRLFWSLRDQSALKSFVRARLQSLADHDRTHKSQFLPTLRTYCELAGRKSDAARALYVERQTLYYRLARIETILDADLSDGDTILGIHLALRAQEYLIDPMK